MDVSPELESATHLSAQEIRRARAVHLYAQGKLSAGKARELTEMDVVTFQYLLNARGIPVNYGLDEFQEDLKTLEQRVSHP